MKLLTAIKKANKKAEQSHGAVRCFINRKSGQEKSQDWCWIKVNLEDISIDGQFSMEDLLSNDWILEEDVV